MNGEQIAVYEAQEFDKLPLEQYLDKNGNPITINVAYPGRNIYANLWKVKVGRINLILLDTDTDLNNEADRSITSQLYGGDN